MRRAGQARPRRPKVTRENVQARDRQSASEGEKTSKKALQLLNEELAALNSRLHEAVQPFIAFAKSGSFKLFGDGFVLTNGSQTRRQLTAGDFRALLAAAGEKEA